MSMGCLATRRRPCRRLRPMVLARGQGATGKRTDGSSHYRPPLVAIRRVGWKLPECRFSSRRSSTFAFKPLCSTNSVGTTHTAYRHSAHSSRRLVALGRLVQETCFDGRRRLAFARSAMPSGVGLQPNCMFLGGCLWSDAVDAANGSIVGSASRQDIRPRDERCGSSPSDGKIVESVFVYSFFRRAHLLYARLIQLWFGTHHRRPGIGKKRRCKCRAMG